MIKTFTAAALASISASTRPFVERFPFTWFRTMREEAPVYYDESLQAWSIFLYEDVQRILTDHVTFSSVLESGLAYEQGRTELLTSDPPAHRRLRNSVNQAFTPRRIAALAPRIAEVVQSVLDQALTRTELDLVDDIAYPIPATVISEMLGIPEDLRPYLHTFLRLPVDDPAHVSDLNIPPSLEIRDALTILIEQRRRQPGADLISALLQAQEDGLPLSNQEIVDLCVLLYIAGHLTTSDLIAHTFLCFAEIPHLLEQVRANLQVIPALIEEVLRYYGTVLAFPRRVTQDLTLRGQHLRTGDAVVVWYASANHDEHAYPAAAHFDLTRSPNKHLAFGHGIHFCLGAPLARLEAPIALRAMLERMDHITFAPHDQLRIRPRWQFFSLEHLPITVQPVPLYNLQR